MNTQKWNVIDIAMYSGKASDCIIGEITVRYPDKYHNLGLTLPC